MKNEQKKFEIGDVVCLPSNPDVPMTVEEVSEMTNDITVVWLDPKNKRHAAVFQKQTLKPFCETPD